MIEQLRKRELWVSIILIAVVAAVTFLPLVSQLGYYHDDWHVIASQESGISLLRMFSVDRPGLGVVYTVTYKILGENPLYWNLFTFALKVAGAILLLFLLRLIWPQRKVETSLVVLIFVVYPGFLQEPSANTFSNQFIAYTAAIFSILATVVFLKAKSSLVKYISLILGVLSGVFYLFIYEYMIGLEVVRVLLMGYVIFRSPSTDTKKRWRTLLLNWLPYLIGAGGFLYWRIFVFSGSRQTTDIGTLFQTYQTQPLQGLLSLAVDTLKSFVNSVVVAWGLPLYNATLSAQYSDLAISAVLAVVGVGLVLGYVVVLGRAAHTETEVEVPQNDHWARDAMWLGALITLVTLVPVVLSGRDVEFDGGFDRYTLQSTVGIGLLVAGAIFAVPKTIWRNSVIAILVALSIITQYNNTTYYRDYWNVQKNLWWQTTWRVPSLKDGTVIMPLLPANYRFGEDFEIWAPWNRIYRPQVGPIKVVSEVLNNDTAREVIVDDYQDRNFRFITYGKSFSMALIASMPTVDSCVHYIDGSQPQYSGDEDPLIMVVGPYSQIDQISLTGSTANPPEDIFGAEPAHDWCYYYEKADLARQGQDWQQVVALGDEAAQLGLTPKDTSEWLPFIEGYFMVGDTDRAKALAKILEKDTSASDWICMPIVNSATSYTTEFKSFMTHNVCR
ncbi:MAG TPA: hypothetical protein VMC62_01055 [Longilinea sp.]|nr:hypothetical protein [Longilinea sp.]